MNPSLSGTTVLSSSGSRRVHLSGPIQPRLAFAVWQPRLWHYLMRVQHQLSQGLAYNLNDDAIWRHFDTSIYPPTLIFEGIISCRTLIGQFEYTRC
jgi:hypothetical protein